ncbi:uncharacterized protein IL334_004607 [Kwoniella shivajii]|uniref:Uncharacterized protein n=1 Tax=Kwoniella shivajii TaxID=564305 RepID=A0ABZ1D166_9TREE|nr:hypothetical protein IL334_004607 [Kwoniella shivajii]
MLFLYSLSILLLSLFVTAAPISESPRRHSAQSTTFEPLRWLTRFGANIPADSTVDLQWEGGSGQGVDVYYIPQWPEQTDYFPVEIIAGTTANHFTWHTPKKDAYPKGTTFILGINDAVTSLSSEWYDITGMLHFGNH